jgi:hypothetical protein
LDGFEGVVWDLEGSMGLRSSKGLKGLRGSKGLKS